ncbi:MAG TPA: primase-helicase family protein [Xanthobacteraceae bacterium]|nr:primase-helicase family protein [Xanthobacteraceae bacterium]
MSTLGGTGCAVSAEPADQQKTQTELEMEASLRQAARRNTRLYGTSPKNAGTNVIEVEFGPTGNTGPTGVQRGGPSGAARDATGPTSLVLSPGLFPKRTTVESGGLGNSPAGAQSGNTTGSTNKTGSTGNTGPTGTQPWRNDQAQQGGTSPPGETFSANNAPHTETREASEQSANTERVETGFATLPPLRRSPLCGGKCTKDDALAVLNSHFFIGKSNQETAIFRINDDGTIAFLPPEQFKLEIQNILVNVGTKDAPKCVPADKFWKESPKRHQRKLVFKPGGATEPTEYNLWQGFGVVPRRTRRKIWSLLRHIFKVICRSDRAKFEYLIRWLAWAVQNPDKHPGTIIVLKSRKQGTGKSTLGVVMLKIFGSHGALIDDSDRLLGRFNDWVEPVCFILAEEILWAGDHRTTDKLKSRITADTFQIERKNGGIRQIPNRLHALMTTNHDHAVAAGAMDRRNVVYDVLDEKAGDKSWFDRLYRDLNDGGAGEFLDFLQNLQLGDWHPREILKTSETAEQQRMSGDSVSQWSQACIEADAVIGAGRGPYGVDVTPDLGTPVSFETLHAAYTGFCRQNSLRALSPVGFGKACAEMFGPRLRLPALQNGPGNGKRRPWGYDVPTGVKWQGKLDDRLGIK